MFYVCCMSLPPPPQPPAPALPGSPFAGSPAAAGRAAAPPSARPALPQGQAVSPLSGCVFHPGRGRGRGIGSADQFAHTSFSPLSGCVRLPAPGSPAPNCLPPHCGGGGSGILPALSALCRTYTCGAGAGRHTWQFLSGPVFGGIHPGSGRGSSPQICFSIWGSRSIEYPVLSGIPEQLAPSYGGSVGRGRERGIRFFFDTRNEYPITNTASPIPNLYFLFSTLYSLFSSPQRVYLPTPNRTGTSPAPTI
jgi:hypothetical protein